MSKLLPSYYNLEWRLDVEVRLPFSKKYQLGAVIVDAPQLAKRSLMHTVEPSFVLKLSTLAPSHQEGQDKMLRLITSRISKTGDETSVESYVLEADAAHMKHLETQLAAAVAELSAVRTSRLLKYVH